MLVIFVLSENVSKKQCILCNHVFYNKNQNHDFILRIHHKTKLVCERILCMIISQQI